MGQVISLENKIKKQKFNKYNSNFLLDYKMPGPVLFAIDFISAYNNNEDDENKYIYPFEISSEFIKRVDLNYEIKNLKEKFKINWTRYSVADDPMKFYEYKFNITDPSIFNLLSNEFKMSEEDIISYLYTFYIQMFINDYNSKYDNLYRLTFPDKTLVRKSAMSRGDGVLLDALNNIKHINGFSSNYIISRV